MPTGLTLECKMDSYVLGRPCQTTSWLVSVTRLPKLWQLRIINFNHMDLSDSLLSVMVRSRCLFIVFWSYCFGARSPTGGVGPFLRQDDAGCIEQNPHFARSIACLDLTSGK